MIQTSVISTKSAQHGIKTCIAHQESKFVKQSLTIFDIDDTLFKTYATINVKKPCGTIKVLTSDQVNSHQLDVNEEYDFSEFQDSKLFFETSEPFGYIWKTAKNTLNNISKRPGSKMVIVTARGEFTDHVQFMDTFRKHGLNIEKVDVYTVSGSKNKKPLIRDLLRHQPYYETRMFDDHIPNLQDFLDLKNEMPNITFKAFPVIHPGIIADPIII